MSVQTPHGGRARRIHLAFLLAAGIPSSIAGAIGIYLSPHTFRTETLGCLQQKVEVRAKAVGRFLDPFAVELLFLARTWLTLRPHLEATAAVQA
jgi:hypothetical protein